MKKNDMNFLFEMGNIRFIDRMWRRFYNKNFANLAEHHFRAFFIAMVIANNELKNNPDIDTGKIAKMILLHDISESRTGDVDYLARQYTERNEELGINDILAETSVENEFKNLWIEYEKKETIESKIAKDADNLDVDFELAEQRAMGYEDPFESRLFVRDNKLYTDSAKEIWDQIQKANPHDWHLQSRNRFKSGDWSKENN